MYCFYSLLFSCNKRIVLATRFLFSYVEFANILQKSQTSKFLQKASEMQIVSQTICTHGEMDIITDFGSVVGGSNPSGCT